MTIGCESVLDLMLKEAARQQEKPRVAQAPLGATDISYRSLNKNRVPPDKRAGVSLGLHHLEGCGMFAGQPDLCVGKLCRHFRRSEGFICGVNEQDIATLFEEIGRCPENRWRRMSPPTTIPEHATTCRVCGNDQWWRPFGQKRLICGICHPSALPKNQYEDLTHKE